MELPINKDAYVNTYQNILRKLFEGYKSQRHNPVGVVLSGGIDSSLIAHFTCQYFPDAVLFTLVTEKSHDKPYAELMAKHLGKKLQCVLVREKELNERQGEITELLKKAGVETGLMQTSLAAVFYWLCDAAQKHGVKTLFTGQGPDILFAGYNKYKALRAENLQGEIQKDLPLLTVDGARDNAMAGRFNITLINPYLESEFMSFASKVPTELLIHNGQEKYISRLVGAQVGLPIEVVNRPKKAMQYSTGIQNMMKKIIQ